MSEHFIKYTIANVRYERTVRYNSKKSIGKDVWTYVLTKKIHYKNDRLIETLLELHKINKVSNEITVRILDIDIIYDEIMKLNYDISEQRSHNEHYIPIDYNSSSLVDVQQM